MYKLLLNSPKQYWTLGENRVVRPIVWHRWLRRKSQNLTDEQFLSLNDFKGSAEDFVRHFHEEVRLRFFFHPRNQKDFFLNLLAKTQTEESILAEAQNVLDNKFDTLGSGCVWLGDTIDWQKDFKSGKTWELRRPRSMDIMDLDNSSDVKVPWELSRFHQVWWLGKAYWMTRNEQYARKFFELVNDWIEKNPVGLGVNWANGMEPAIRASNWVAGYYFFCDSRSSSSALWLKFFKSLYHHGVFIRNHLEYSWRSGNHLISDFVGLVVLGTFFRHTRFGSKWLKSGVAGLEREMESQVRPDGVDYENSTSYQRLVSELLYTAAILCQINNIKLSPQFWSRLEKMMEFVLCYSRPDGSIPLIGDADDGRLYRFIAGTDINDHRHVLSVGSILFNRADFKNGAGKFHQDALWLFGGEGFEKHQMLNAELSDPGSRAFPDGGFYIMRGKNVHLMADAGDIGMGGMGGHGHNDTLSFEYWLNGEPLIVDSGTYAYTFDAAMRQEFRSTRSHNTVVVDGKEIAKFVGLWLITKDATRSRVSNWTTSSREDIFEAEHHAYETLSKPVVHKRRLVLNKTTQSVEITDILEGSGEHSFESYLHFAPQVKLELIGRNKAAATHQNVNYFVNSDTGTFEVLDTWYSRSYGVREPKKTLRLQFSGTVPLTVVITVAPRL